MVLLGLVRSPPIWYCAYAKQSFAAPGIQPDVDDSATASIALSLLGRPGLSRQMRDQFETKTHFETYKSESNESLSANCNILLALLLDLKYDSGAISAIEKVSKYLATKWFNADGLVKDKWVGYSFHDETKYVKLTCFIRIFPNTTRLCSTPKR